MNKLKLALLAGVSLAALPTFALAQTAVPNSTRPELIEKQFDRPPQPKSQIEAVVPELTPERAPAGAENTIFTLQGVSVDGNTVYSEEEIKPLYADLIGEKVSLKQIFDVAAALNAKYRNDGYILTRVVVPPQTVNDGTVRLQVVEGYVDDVTIEGEISGDRDLIDGYMEQLKLQKPVNAQDIERLVLLINELPGVTAQSVLRRSDDSVGASTLAIIIEDDPYEGFLTLDNRGTRYVGPTQVSGGFSTNSLLGLYDQFNFRYITTDFSDELALGEFNYTQPVGPYGTVLKLTAVRARVEPGFILAPNEIESDSIRYSAALEHPIIRSRAENWYVTGQFDYRDSKTTTLDSLTTRDHIRSVSLGTSYDWVDSWLGVTLLSLNASQGLDILDATETGTPNLSRAAGHSDFTKVNFDASRLQEIDGPVSLLASFTGQYAFSQLLAAQQFSFGGPDFGRAYEPSELTGDHGAAVSLELRYDVNNDDEYFNEFQFYTSYDIGAVWQIENNGIDNRVSGSSVAAGIRMNISEGLSGDLQVAVPLTKDVSSYGSGGDDPRGYFSITTRF